MHAYVYFIVHLYIPWVYLVFVWLERLHVTFPCTCVRDVVGVRDGGRCGVTVSISKALYCVCLCVCTWMHPYKYMRICVCILSSFGVTSNFRQWLQLETRQLNPYRYCVPLTLLPRVLCKSICLIWKLVSWPIRMCACMHASVVCHSLLSSFREHSLW